MAQSTVVDTIRAHLDAGWHHCDVFNENEETSMPNDGSPFLVLQFPIEDRQQITFGAPGSNVFRETGVARFVLNVRRGDGLTIGRQWADTLIPLFLAKDLNGVITKAPRGPVTDDRNDRGSYWQLTIAVPYEFDFLG